MLMMTAFLAGYVLRDLEEIISRGQRDATERKPR